MKYPKIFINKIVIQLYYQLKELTDIFTLINVIYNTIINLFIASFIIISVFLLQNIYYLIRYNFADDQISNNLKYYTIQEIRNQNKYSRALQIINIVIEYVIPLVLIFQSFQTTKGFENQEIELINKHRQDKNLKENQEDRQTRKQNVIISEIKNKKNQNIFIFIIYIIWRLSHVMMPSVGYRIIKDIVLSQVLQWLLLVMIQQVIFPQIQYQRSKKDSNDIKDTSQDLQLVCQTPSIDEQLDHRRAFKILRKVFNFNTVKVDSKTKQFPKESRMIRELKTKYSMVYDAVSNFIINRKDSSQSDSSKITEKEKQETISDFKKDIELFRHFKMLVERKEDNISILNQIRLVRPGIQVRLIEQEIEINDITITDIDLEVNNPLLDSPHFRGEYDETKQFQYVSEEDMIRNQNEQFGLKDTNYQGIKDIEVNFDFKTDQLYHNLQNYIKSSQYLEKSVIKVLLFAYIKIKLLQVLNNEKEELGSITQKWKVQKDQIDQDVITYNLHEDKLLNLAEKYRQPLKVFIDARTMSHVAKKHGCILEDNKPLVFHESFSQITQFAHLNHNIFNLRHYFSQVKDDLHFGNQYITSYTDTNTFRLSLLENLKPLEPENNNDTGSINESYFSTKDKICLSLLHLKHSVNWECLEQYGVVRSTNAAHDYNFLGHLNAEILSNFPLNLLTQLFEKQIDSMNMQQGETQGFQFLQLNMLASSTLFIGLLGLFIQLLNMAYYLYILQELKALHLPQLLINMNVVQFNHSENHVYVLTTILQLVFIISTNLTLQYFSHSQDNIEQLKAHEWGYYALEKQPPYRWDKFDQVISMICLVLSLISGVTTIWVWYQLQSMRTLYENQYLKQFGIFIFNIVFKILKSLINIIMKALARYINTFNNRESEDQRFNDQVKMIFLSQWLNCVVGWIYIAFLKESFAESCDTSKVQENKDHIYELQDCIQEIEKNQILGTIIDLTLMNLIEALLSKLNQDLILAFNLSDLIFKPTNFIKNFLERLLRSMVNELKSWQQSLTDVLRSETTATEDPLSEYKRISNQDIREEMYEIAFVITNMALVSFANPAVTILTWFGLVVEIRLDLQKVLKQNARGRCLRVPDLGKFKRQIVQVIHACGVLSLAIFVFSSNNVHRIVTEDLQNEPQLDRTVIVAKVAFFFILLFLMVVMKFGLWYQYSQDANWKLQEERNRKRSQFEKLLKIELYSKLNEDAYQTNGSKPVTNDIMKASFETKNCSYISDNKMTVKVFSTQNIDSYKSIDSNNTDLMSENQFNSYDYRNINIDEYKANK